MKPRVIAVGRRALQGMAHHGVRIAGATVSAARQHPVATAGAVVAAIGGGWGGYELAHNLAVLQQDAAVTLGFHRQDRGLGLLTELLFTPTGAFLAGAVTHWLLTPEAP